jgi:hypothetical protein
MHIAYFPDCATSTPEILGRMPIGSETVYRSISRQAQNNPSTMQLGNGLGSAGSADRSHKRCPTVILLICGYARAAT